MRGIAVGLVWIVACGSTNVVPDAGDEAGMDAGVATTGPIVAPADTWTWVEFPESRCAHGSAAGIGINPHPGATRLVVFMQGGGACFDADTCWGPNPKARHLDGASFGGEQASRVTLLRRTGDPFVDANLVYVPYCTGDLHAGNATVMMDVGGTMKPTYFWGGKNIDIYLERLLPTFPGTTRVILTGESAGGYGSFVNADRFRNKFKVRVDTIDDSGPPFDDPSQVSTVADGGTSPVAAWGMIWPAGCTKRTLVSDIFDCNRMMHPEERFGFISFHEDSGIASSYKISTSTFASLVDQLETEKIGPDPNAASLLIEGVQGHGVLEQGYDGVIIPWIKQMQMDDPNWTSEKH